MTKAEIAIQKLNQLHDDIERVNEALDVLIAQKKARKMQNYLRGARAVFTGMFDEPIKPKQPIYTQEQRQAELVAILTAALGSKPKEPVTRLRVFGRE